MNEPHSNRSPLLIFHIDMNYVCLKTDYLRKWLETIARMGYDAILWELEDKVRWDTCPECVWPEAMSKEQFKELLAFSRGLGLEPIPLLQTVGHAEYVLKHDRYLNLRESPDRHDCYCTSNPVVRELLIAWIDEYVEIFGEIRYFHLGGDEAYVFGTCPICQAYTKEHGKTKLYAEHIIEISRHLRDKKIRPGIWGDMLLAHPDEIAEIPKDFVIWDWNYWDAESNRDSTRIWSEGTGRVTLDQLTEEHRQHYPHILDADGKFRMFYTSDMLKAMGYDVILCSATRSSGDSAFIPNHAHHLENVVAAAKKTAISDLHGNCVTSWALRLNSFETQAVTIGLVPYAVSRPEQPSAETIREYGDRFWGCDASPFLEAAKKLSSPIPFAQQGSTAIQWNQGLKDSLPAPPGYLADLLETWKRSEARIRDTWVDLLKKSKPDIAEGFRLLILFAASVPPCNTEYADAWLKAAYFQHWHAYVGGMILENEKRTIPVELPKRLKQEFEFFLARVETPESARKNAGLVYDALIEYCQTQSEHDTP
jgi:hypothetical protein